MKITERSFLFAVRVTRLCRHLEKQNNTTRTVANQLLRSGTSIGANIEEAQGAQSRADFISKMTIALKESRESLYWLKLLQASALADSNMLSTLTKESDELSKIIGAIVKNTKTNST